MQVMSVYSDAERGFLDTQHRPKDSRFQKGDASFQLRYR